VSTCFLYDRCEGWKKVKEKKSVARLKRKSNLLVGKWEEEQFVSLYYGWRDMKSTSRWSSLWPAVFSMNALSLRPWYSTIRIDRVMIRIDLQRRGVGISSRPRARQPRQAAVMHGALYVAGTESKRVKAQSIMRVKPGVRPHSAVTFCNRYTHTIKALSTTPRSLRIYRLRKFRFILI